MESFSITSESCFRGLFTLPKNISWGNTEMLLHTYCIGHLPKMRNGSGFWHHWRDSGMIIILAWSSVGSMSESFSLFCSLPLSLCIYCMCLCVCDKKWKFMIPVGQMPPESPLIFHSPALLCLLGLSFCAYVFASLYSCFLSLVVQTRAAYDSGYSTWQQVRGTLLNHTHTLSFVSGIKYLTSCTIQTKAKVMCVLCLSLLWTVVSRAARVGE